MYSFAIILQLVSIEHVHKTIRSVFAIFIWKKEEFVRFSSSFFFQLANIFVFVYLLSNLIFKLNFTNSNSPGASGKINTTE